MKQNVTHPCQLSSLQKWGLDSCDQLPARHLENWYNREANLAYESKKLHNHAQSIQYSDYIFAHLCERGFLIGCIYFPYHILIKFPQDILVNHYRLNPCGPFNSQFLSKISMESTTSCFLQYHLISMNRHFYVVFIISSYVFI